MSVTAAITTPFFGLRVGLLSAARLFAFVYLTWLILNQVDHEHYYFAVPLVLISSILTWLALEHFRYDLRSSVVILIVICQIYFFGRVDFISRPWGWYYILSQAAYLMFMTGLLVGVKLFGNKIQGNKIPPSPHQVLRQIPSARRLYAVGVVTLAAYTAGLSHLLTSVGASGSFMELVFQSLATRLAIADNGLSPLLQLMYVLSSFGLGCGYILWHDHKHRLLFIAWIFLLAFSALVLGSRGAIVLPVIQIILATSLLIRRPLRTLGLLALPLIIVVNVFSTWYLAAREGQDALSDESYSLLNRFDAYENWLGFSASQGLEIAPGASIPAVFLQFVPRRLYPEKPYYFSTEMTRIYVPEAFDRGVNLDFGGIAESIYNFGPIGPPLFGLFLSWLACRIDRFKEQALQLRDPLYAYIFAQGVLIPSSFFFIGWINTAMVFGIIGFLLTIKIFTIIASRQRRYAEVNYY